MDPKICIFKLLSSSILQIINVNWASTDIMIQFMHLMLCQHNWKCKLGGNTQKGGDSHGLK